MRGPAEVRFLAKVDKDGPVPSIRPDLGPCWMWLGAKCADGYGRFYADGKSRTASRWSYEHFTGVLPEGWEPDHLCRTPLCVNPDHMEGVPKRVNILRGIGASARHAEKTHCPQGHAYDGRNTIHHKGRRYCRACRKHRGRRRSPARTAA